MDDYIDVAVFGEETTDKAGRKKVNPIFIQKYKLTTGIKKMVIRVKDKPVKVGIDPYNKLIDRKPDDNQGMWRWSKMKKLNPVRKICRVRKHYSLSLLNYLVCGSLVKATFF